MLQVQGRAIAQGADDIKSAGLFPCLVGRQPRAGSAAEGALFCDAQGMDGAAVAVAAARFHFNKNNGVAVTADDIQFQTGLTPVTVKYGVALAGQQGRRGFFAFFAQKQVRGCAGFFVSAFGLPVFRGRVLLAGHFVKKPRQQAAQVHSKLP